LYIFGTKLKVFIIVAFLLGLFSLIHTRLTEMSVKCQAQTVVVNPEDNTFWAIAHNHCSGITSNVVDMMVEKNPKLKPDQLQYGQIVVLPNS
jgi:hypothetical protein